MEDSIFASITESPYIDSSGATGESGRWVTPGLIVSFLTPSRLAEVQKHAETLPPRDQRDAGSQAVRMLAVLRADELRTIARSVGLPAEGNFIDLFRRLVIICRAT